MVDVVKNISEDIYKACREAGLPPPIAAILIQQHEEIKMLQAYATDLAQHTQGLIEALRLSQTLHRENKAALERIERRYNDNYKDEVGPEQIN